MMVKQNKFSGEERNKMNRLIKLFQKRKEENFYLVLIFYFNISSY